MLSPLNPPNAFVPSSIWSFQMLGNLGVQIKVFQTSKIYSHLEFSTRKSHKKCSQSNRPSTVGCMQGLYTAEYSQRLD